MAANNQPRIVGYDPNTGAPIYANASGGSAKVIKWILLGLIVVVLGVAALIVYDNFFNLTEVNLFEHAEDFYEVDGYSGEGVLVNYIQDYQGSRAAGNEPYASEFYNSIKYSVNKKEGLKNGDKIIITAIYDKSLARKAKLKAASDTAEFTVADLRERYARDGSDIQANDINAMREYMNDFVARSVYDNYNDEKSEGLVRLLYVSPEATDYEDYNDKMIGFYKVTYYDSWEETRMTRYYPCIMEPITKGPDYAKEIDQMDQDGDIYISLGSYDDNLNALIEQYKTDYNRCQITELKTK